jgi:hypothetical protein
VGQLAFIVNHPSNNPRPPQAGQCLRIARANMMRLAGKARDAGRLAGMAEI